MAKGGSGDLLSGVIASFMAQGLTPLEASILGTYIVYKTARDLSIDHTSYYVTPILIANNMYKTFAEIKKIINIASPLKINLNKDALKGRL